MIIGGVDIPQGPVFKRTKVTITREKQTRDYLPEVTLSFNDEDAEGIEQPRNDALIMSILMNKNQVKRMLIDPDSSANIILSKIVEQLGLQDQIMPEARVLNCFKMASKTTNEKIILPANVVGTIQETNFHVIEGDMRYNVLLGRPEIHNMRVVPSTLHQVLKFQTSEGIKMAYGEQPAAKEMFAIDEVIPISALSSTKGSESKGKQKVK
uniref:Uncharacterized protein n=1 Tax=Nicotiana tabacum TaxID=4097 RepID=A0A1S3XYX3_TOBAC|nr:PREDICTED: uncharacterized protein LOC107770354 [Nicotiana tabacum]